VVVLVVDQMRADYIERFRGQWRSGLRRLVDQGAWLRNAAYPYAATETCPGHATISTGVFPAQHGIVGNAWWDRGSEERTRCTEDSSVHNADAEGATSSPGDSAARLEASTFAEQLRAAIPGSRVVTLSLKARSAIMLAGHQADAVLWMDEDSGEWLTSTAYGRELPAFARQFLRANPVAADFSKVWQLALPEASYRGGATVSGAEPPSGWGAEFPHSLAAGEDDPDDDFYERWRSSPFADAYLARLAAAAIDEMKLGSGPGLDFLGIGFSATDYIGHDYGPDSREIEDSLLVLDQTIGALLDALDRAVGRGQYVVALTADHGVAPIPEQAEEQGRDAGRVNMQDIIDRIEFTVSRAMGPERHVAQTVGSNLYFAPETASRLRDDADLWRAVEEAILDEPGVQRVIRRWGPRVQARALDRGNGFGTFPGRSGDLFIALKPYWIFSGRQLFGWSGGTNHGNGNEYDRRVPIVLFGTGIRPGQYRASATPADIAPTLASLCGIRIARTDGRILTEAIAAAPARQTRRSSQ
jgi:predicted AlkP superfamily pyrophosphatase or phosphodiesterase